MNKGAILAAIVVVGYISFEVFALQKLQYRVEPLYRYDQFVTANRAYVSCGDPQDDRRERFLRNLAAVRGRAFVQLSEQNPDKTENEVMRMLDDRTQAGDSQVTALVLSQGCDSSEIRRLLRRYTIRARLRTR